MNSISIHQTKLSPIAETCQDSTVERSHDINIDLYSAERWSVPTFYERQPLEWLASFAVGGTEFRAVGNWFDGLMGYNPELPHLKDYWEGYAIGYREYCCGLLGLEMPLGEIPVEKLSALMAA